MIPGLQAVGGLAMVVIGVLLLQAPIRARILNGIVARRGEISLASRVEEYPKGLFIMGVLFVFGGLGWLLASF